MEDNSFSAVTDSLSLNSSPVRFGQLSRPHPKPVPIARSTSAIGVKRKLGVSFQPPSKIPKRLGVSTMFKLGHAIADTQASQEIVDVSSFNIDEMVWSPPVSVPFTIEKEEFAKGGFRVTYKATSKSPKFEGKSYIVKRILPKTVELIEAVNKTEEDHSRKSVQMQALARNFTEQIAAKIEKDGNQDAFGNPLTFVEALLGKIQSTNEVVTIEEFLPGEFQKYVNNDGSFSQNADPEKQRKAESLVHF